MKVTPVKRYQNPAFPTRSIIDERPELLQLVPRRWQGNPTVIAALTGMCVLMAGARDVQAKDNTKAAAPRVAPIFQHGTGQGAFGCIVVNPPVFLSEEEARKVIVEEARHYGIQFKLSNLTNPDGTPVEEPASYPITMDGVDEKRKISFEYVSAEFARQWNQPKPKITINKTEDGKSLSATITGELASMVASYDTKRTAEQLRALLDADTKQGVTGVFYDPLTPRWDPKAAAPSRAPGAEKRQEISREELRRQVQDFIKWLKAEGVI